MIPEDVARLNWLLPEAVNDPEFAISPALNDCAAEKELGVVVKATAFGRIDAGKGPFVRLPALINTEAGRIPAVTFDAETCEAETPVRFEPSP